MTSSLVAATRGPGLVAALLVGFCAAKALAAARELPFAAVDHLHGHLAASFLKPAEFEPPFLALIASGGHTLLADVRDRGPELRVLGQTLDDAAGEAFDKGARLLGSRLSGRRGARAPGGRGRPRVPSTSPPAARMPGLDFSFAGLKTALLYRVRDLGEQETERRRADLAASYQRAIVDALLIRVKRALKQTGCDAACDRRRGRRQRASARRRSAASVSSSTSLRESSAPTTPR